MQVNMIGDGFEVSTRRYAAVVRRGLVPTIRIWREGQLMADLPAVSGLAAVDRPEALRCIRIESIRQQRASVSLRLRAESNLWGRRAFEWTFTEDGIEHAHRAEGECRPGRAYFASNGSAEGNPKDLAGKAGFGAVIHAARTFSPAANLADEYERMLGIPLSLGILPEVPTPFAYGVPDRAAMIFAPPPLCLMFGDRDRWLSFGLGAAPGECQFNAFEYGGATPAGSRFYVNYLGYRTARPFRSPRLILRFGFSPHEALERYVAQLDALGFSTPRRRANPAWHRAPIFCGWGEQCRLASRRGVRAGDLCTQANYEQWVEVLARRGLPFGTIVVDDKWQAGYGSFAVDEAKWPDLAGFVKRAHRQGRHVLLWVPTYHAEGVPEELCVENEDGKRYADVSHPGYQRFLRRQLRHLVRDVGVDGFKVDWVWGITRRPGLRTHAPLHGIEWLRKFQSILYEETHRWRPDAMVETHSANPLFRDCSDVLRLNDLPAGARQIADSMAQRARIARIAGWSLVDCDAAADTVEGWWQYMQTQPAIGTPALYFADATHRTAPQWMWDSLVLLWREYCRQTRVPEFAKREFKQCALGVYQGINGGFGVRTSGVTAHGNRLHIKSNTCPPGGKESRK